MSINVTCQCGASFAVPEQFAGRQAACPKCKQPLTIPQTPPTATPPQQVPPPATAVSPTPPAAPAPPAPPVAPVPPVASAPVQPPQAAPLPPTPAAPFTPQAAAPQPAAPVIPQAGPPVPPAPSAPVAPTPVNALPPVAAAPVQPPASPFQINTESAQPAGRPATTGEPVRRRTNSKKSNRNVMLGICGASLVIIAAGLTVFFLNQEDDNNFTASNNNGSTDTTIPVETSQASMVTEAEAQVAINAINNGLDNTGADVMGSLIDIAAMCDIALKPYTSDSNGAQMNAAKNSFQIGVSEGFTESVVGEIDTAIYGGTDEFGQEVGGGGDYVFLKFRELDGYKTALFRFTLGGDEGGINYHELMFAKVNGQTKIVDIFVFTTGERMSQTLRRAFLPLATQIDQSAISRLLGGSQVDEINQMLNISESIQAGNYQLLLTQYDQLPAKLKQDKNMLMNRINAASMLMSFDNLGNVVNGQPYLDALEDLQKFHPTDKSLPILMIDYHLLSDDLDGTLKAIEQLDGHVGGDPYLHVLKSDSCYSFEEYDRAKQFLAKAIEADPNMSDAYLSQIDLAFIDDDYDSILEALKRLHDLGVVMNLSAVPEFRPFASSPQFDEYFEYVSQ